MASNSNRGVVYLNPGSVEVQSIDFPTFRNPAGKMIDHGVILKVVTTNICGSDQHMVRGRTTAPAGMVLGHEITDLEILDVTALLDHFAGNLVAEHHAGRRRRATADHVLVGTADIRGYDLENDAVVDRLSGRIAKARKIDLLNFDAAGFEVNHATIGIRRHMQSPLGSHAGLGCEWRSFCGPREAIGVRLS